MKILYLTTGCFDKGGISRYNRYQISALREIHGNENVKVFSLLGPTKFDFEESFSVNWNAWGASKLSKLIYVLKIIIAINRWKPDLIWIGHVNLTEILVRFKLFPKAISVLNIYGLEVWSGLRPKVEEGFRSVNYVISDCHYTANYVEGIGIRKKGTIEVIWDCVDLEKFQKQEIDDFHLNYNLPDPKKYPWVLTLGRLTNSASHKGYDRLLNVFKNVSVSNTRAVLIFAGQGDLIPDLKLKAKQFGISDRVFFSGMVHEQDISKFYSAATVFSLVSDRGIGRGEGIPLTPLEAMACGTTIVVGNQDGSQEAIFNQINGYCIDPLDLDVHSKVILDILEDDILRLSKEKAALEIVRKHFSYKGFLEKHRIFQKKHRHIC